MSGTTLRLTCFPPGPGPYERWELTVEETGEVLERGATMPIDEHAVRTAAAKYRARLAVVPREMMSGLARIVDDALNRVAGRKGGFVLVVFPLDETAGGRAEYVSNAASHDAVIAALKRQIALIEGGPN